MIISLGCIAVIASSWIAWRGGNAWSAFLTSVTIVGLGFVIRLALGSSMRRIQEQGAVQAIRSNRREIATHQNRIAQASWTIIVVGGACALFGARSFDVESIDWLPFILGLYCVGIGLLMSWMLRRAIRRADEELARLARTGNESRT